MTPLRKYSRAQVTKAVRLVSEGQSYTAAARQARMSAWVGAGGRIGLDRLCKALGIPGKDDFYGSMVWDAVQRGEISKVAEYCDDDVRRLRAVHRRIRGFQTPAVQAVAAE